MKEGKDYKVIYKDGERVLAKDLEFKGQENGFLVFSNNISGKLEYLPISSIVRIEGGEIDEKINR